METINAGDENTRFQLLLELVLDLEAFISDWAHCDRISTYAARMIGHNRSDSLLYSNLFSSALNELLETAFRLHAPDGAFACRVLRCGNVDRIELVIPADENTRRFYAAMVSELEGRDVKEKYRTALFLEGPFDPRVSFLELAVDYKARIGVEPVGSAAILLSADLALEEV